MINARVTKDGQSVLSDFLRQDIAYFWIDLFQPTIDEIKSVEDYYGVKIPLNYTRTGMVINRFLHDDHTCYMTLLTNEDKNVVLILKNNTLITINNFNKQFLDPGKNHITNVTDAFSFVVEAFTQNIAEALEKLAQKASTLSAVIQQYAKDEIVRRTRRTIAQKITLMQLNNVRELIANNHSGLINLRLLINFSKKCYVSLPEQVIQSIDVLIDHTEFLNHKIADLHDTVLGYIGITQYNLQSSFNLFSATFFLPALVMGFFSMNFSNIPFLQVQNSIYFFIFVAVLGVYLIYHYLGQLQFA
ncbi:MAG: CorA family divalent cation transporter [Pseudomonadota bacterium]